MMNSYHIYTGVVIVSIIILYLIHNLVQSEANIQSIHAMNLDKDTNRWNNLLKSANEANLRLERWSATYGKDIPYDEFRELGVGHAMIRPNRNDKKNENLVNLGVVGCFISTRNLLTYLSKQSFPNSAGHLILDDDVQIPKDFTIKWNRISKSIPGDWDIIYLGIWDITGKHIAPGVKKLRSQRRSEHGLNVGTFAYIVRHGAIKSKILPWLRYMIDAIDEQYIYKFDEWNVYGVEPNIITVNNELNMKSSINEINI